MSVIGHECLAFNLKWQKSDQAKPLSEKMSRLAIHRIDARVPKMTVVYLVTCLLNVLQTESVASYFCLNGWPQSSGAGSNVAAATWKGGGGSGRVDDLYDRHFMASALAQQSLEAIN